MTLRRVVLVALAALAVPTTCVALPIIDIHKFVNGIESVTPPGPTVPVNSTITFTYQVDNDGDVPLTAVSVIDDNGTAGNLGDDFFPTFVGGDSDGNGLLGVDEEWVYVAAISSGFEEGPFQNVAVASAQSGTGPTVDAAVAHYNVGATQVLPEPGTIALLAFGLAGLGFARRRKRQ